MKQTRAELPQSRAEWLRWVVTRPDDARVARRLYCKQRLAGMYRLDEGVLLEDFCHFLDRARGLRILSELYGKAIQCEMCPYMQFILHYGLKTLFGIERIKVLPALLSSDEALRLVVGFNAQHAR